MRRICVSNTGLLGKLFGCAIKTHQKATLLQLEDISPDILQGKTVLLITILKRNNKEYRHAKTITTVCRKLSLQGMRKPPEEEATGRSIAGC